MSSPDRSEATRPLQEAPQHLQVLFLSDLASEAVGLPQRSRGDRVIVRPEYLFTSTKNRSRGDKVRSYWMYEPPSTGIHKGGFIDRDRIGIYKDKHGERVAIGNHARGLIDSVYSFSFGLSPDSSALRFFYNPVWGGYYNKDSIFIEWEEEGELKAVHLEAQDPLYDTEKHQIDLDSPLYLGHEDADYQVNIDMLKRVGSVCKERSSGEYEIKFDEENNTIATSRRKDGVLHDRLVYPARMTRKTIDELLTRLALRPLLDNFIEADPTLDGWRFVPIEAVMDTIGIEWDRNIFDVDLQSLRRR